MLVPTTILCVFILYSIYKWDSIRKILKSISQFIIKLFIFRHINITKVLVLVLAFNFSYTLINQSFAQVQIIGPNAGRSGNTSAAERAKKASANIKTAIEFLNNWGLNDEADNIQKWFEKEFIYLDLDLSGAETSTASGSITLDGLLLLGGSKATTNLQHKFDPKNAKDKEFIAELAFTLVHEKVHAHQTYSSFIFGREGNETEAYNKEIKDADLVINKMIAKWFNALLKGDKEKMKDLGEWIDAVVEEKLKALGTFNDNYPDSRKKNWADDFIEKLKKLRDLNIGFLKRIKSDENITNEETLPYKNLLIELQNLENVMPAVIMPLYWMELKGKNYLPYVTVKYEEQYKTVIFYNKSAIIKILLPDDIRAGDQISGTIIIEHNNAILGKDELVSGQISDTYNYQVEINDTKLNINNQLFSFALADNRISKYFVIGLKNREGKLLASSKFFYDSSAIIVNNTPRDTSHSFELPNISELSAPIQIKGQFDGNSSNTKCIINNTALQIMTETPRKALVTIKEHVSGIVNFKIVENNKELNKEIRIIDLQLNVSKTKLTKGEKTNLNISVEGLKNLKSNIFLQLTSFGAVNMKGGNNQTINIQPNEIKSNGFWTAKRTLVGIEDGDFMVNAKVSDKAP